MDINNVEFPSQFAKAMEETSLLPEERIKQIFQLPSWFSYVNDRLIYKEYSEPSNVNEDLDTLITWYVNKKSKRVKYAGTKLRKAFLELPPVEQRKVGLALLTGGKTDTEWVCKRLDNYKPSWDKDWVVNWNPCYTSQIEQVWDKHRGKFCGRLLIQFLDESVVCLHLDELLEEDELYFGLCRRFVNHSWFNIDSERLANCTSINAYLSIMSQTSVGISEFEAKKLLFQWIATISAMIKQQYCTFKREHLFWRYRLEEHRVIYAWGIDTALYYLLKMNLIDVVYDFLKWDQTVYEKYYSELSHDDDSPENQGKFVDFILEMLPEEYEYLRYIDDEHYTYALSAGQPFTNPHLKPWWQGYGHIYQPYGNSKNDKESNNETSQQTNGYIKKNIEVQYASEEEIRELLSKNPNLQGLVDKLGLTPAQPFVKTDFDPDSCPF